MSNYFEDRKGISVLVSNVLMLLIVVVAASIVFAFVNLYVNNYQKESGAALMERLLIEDVWFKNGKNIEIAVYNYGKIDSEIIMIFINGKSLTIQTNIRVAEQEILKINFDWSQDETYRITLLTGRGYSIESNYTSP